MQNVMHHSRTKDPRNHSYLSYHEFIIYLFLYSRLNAFSNSNLNKIILKFHHKFYNVKLCIFINCNYLFKNK